MAKRRIAILGGGMAGLSAAYQLTKTPELQAENEVTLYQLGWRLGGKAASGRDATGRNLEHGLHVWFGCYENTFQTIQEVYAARQPPTGWALATWQDAVKPQRYTPIGIEDAQGNWNYWPVTWADNDGVPGNGQLMPTFRQILETVADWIILYLEGKEQPSAAAAIAAAGPPPAHTPIEPHPLGALRGLKARLFAAADRIGATLVDERDHLVELAQWADDAYAGTIGLAARPASEQSIGRDILNIFKTIVKGMFDDLLVPDAPLVSIDNIEFRAWLLKHGADPQIVAKSSIVRVVYDTLFQYAEGDDARPDLAAGTGLGTVLRLVGTYQGSMMWEVQAGMGEVIVGPLYQHLVRAGVQFNFFHKVTQIAPDATGKAVASVSFDIQAAPVSGSYAPVTVTDGLVLWPTQPFWEQLENGAAMKAAGVNFESHWNSWPAAGPATIKAGADFDVVVLAVAVGAFKPLNTEDGSFCAPLIAANQGFANWVNSMTLVPSIGVQLWCNVPTARLGWNKPKPAAVSGPEYLDIWADMSQVIAFETQSPKPLSLHYLTGTYATELYKQPASATNTPAQAAAEIRTMTAGWLNQSSMPIWPAARAGGEFDWSLLAAPASVHGEARLDAQYLRANIDPTECCALSGTNTTQYRPHADSLGFTNLVVAGEGTVMGFTTSFEGAVASGAAASRAICGHPEKIVGYDFLDRKPSQGPG